MIADTAHQFREIADNAPVMIWRADTTKACDFFNKPWLDYTGRRIEQELGRGWTAGVHPEDLEALQTIYRAAQAERRPDRPDRVHHAGEVSHRESHQGRSG